MRQEIQTGPGVTKIVETAPEHPSTRPLTEAPVSVTEEELKHSSAARLVAKYETDMAYRRRTSPSAFARAKAALVQERSKRLEQAEHADRTRAAAALKPRLVQPRAPMHFGAEIDGALRVTDDAPLEVLLDPRYWSRSFVPRSDASRGGSATLVPGRKMDIVASSGELRGIRLEVVECTVGPAPDAHVVHVRQV